VPTIDPNDRRDEIVNLTNQSVWFHMTGRPSQFFRGTLRQSGPILPGYGYSMEVAQVALKAGETVRITATSHTGRGTLAFDTVLALTDATGFYYENDDAPDMPLYQSRIVTTVPRDGIYTITIAGWDTNEAGQWEVGVESIDGGPTTRVTLAPGRRVAVPDSIFLYDDAWNMARLGVLRVRRHAFAVGNDGITESITVLPDRPQLYVKGFPETATTNGYAYASFANAAGQGRLHFNTEEPAGKGLLAEDLRTLSYYMLFTFGRTACPTVKVGDQWYVVRELDRKGHSYGRPNNSHDWEKFEFDVPHIRWNPFDFTPGAPGVTSTFAIDSGTELAGLPPGPITGFGVYSDAFYNASTSAGSERALGNYWNIVRWDVFEAKDHAGRVMYREPFVTRYNPRVLKDGFDRTSPASDYGENFSAFTGWRDDSPGRTHHTGYAATFYPDNDGRLVRAPESVIGVNNSPSDASSDGSWILVEIRKNTGPSELTEIRFDNRNRDLVRVESGPGPGNEKVTTNLVEGYSLTYIGVQYVGPDTPETKIARIYVQADDHQEALLELEIEGTRIVRANKKLLETFASTLTQKYEKPFNSTVSQSPKLLDRRAHTVSKVIEPGVEVVNGWNVIPALGTVDVAVFQQDGDGDPPWSTIPSEITQVLGSSTITIQLADGIGLPDTEPGNPSGAGNFDADGLLSVAFQDLVMEDMDNPGTTTALPLASEYNWGSSNSLPQWRGLQIYFADFTSSVIANSERKFWLRVRGDLIDKSAPRRWRIYTGVFFTPRPDEKNLGNRVDVTGGAIYGTPLHTSPNGNGWYLPGTVDNRNTPFLEIEYDNVTDQLTVRVL